MTNVRCEFAWYIATLERGPDTLTNGFFTTNRVTRQQTDRRSERSWLENKAVFLGIRSPDMVACVPSCLLHVLLQDTPIPNSIARQTRISTWSLFLFARLGRASHHHATALSRLLEASICAFLLVLEGELILRSARVLQGEERHLSACDYVFLCTKAPSREPHCGNDRKRREGMARNQSRVPSLSKCQTT